VTGQSGSHCTDNFGRNAYSFGGVPTDMAIPRATPELLKLTSVIGSTIGWKLQKTCAELIPAEISKSWTKIKKIIMNIWECIGKRMIGRSLTLNSAVDFVSQKWIMPSYPKATRLSIL
jgi:hypothetical protein